jgi:hypothetical protein
VASAAKNPNPQEAADKGDAIYAARYKAVCEEKYPGKFIAIDITTEKAWVGDTPEGVLGTAQGANPSGFFHLIRIGSPGVFRVGYTQSEQRDYREWFA